MSYVRSTYVLCLLGCTFPHFLYWVNWKRYNNITVWSNRIFQFTEFNKMERVMSVLENLCLLICLPQKKWFVALKLNMSMFFIKSPACSTAFQLFHNIISLFLIVLSSTQWNLHTHFTYSIKIFTEASGSLF